jgi:tetratricopeptide (TPR) repeat protein
LADLEVLRSLAAARAGRWDDARTLAQQAISIAQGAGQKEAAGAVYAITADWEALAGNADRARTAVTKSLQLSQGRDTTYAAAFALARINDAARADALTATLAQRFPEDTSVRFSYLPTLRAMQALRAHDPAKAIAVLEEARANGDGIPALAFIHGPGWAYPSFVRGQALAAMGRRDEAAKEYQRILAHRGLLGVDPIGAIVERELARLTP